MRIDKRHFLEVIAGNVSDGQELLITKKAKVHKDNDTGTVFVIQKKK